MKKNLIIVLIASLCFVVVGCGKNITSDGKSDLNTAYEKIGEYFGDSNNDRSNLGAYYLDTENNVIVVVLVDNSKEEQETFLNDVVIDSKYIKFVEGGPYSTS